MIKFIFLQNRQGKTRLSKWYESGLNLAEKMKMEQEVHRIVAGRDAKFTNFVEYRHYKIIYRRYAGLFFTLGVDMHDNELGMLELIHLFVEILDGYFGNVCELDLVFHFDKVYLILDELLLAGEISETSSTLILQKLKQSEKLE
ncbi:unnamed protein product [Amoebophrya sp. A120]|nr:unnamed protein product [Amoebophrya sp. A120]|eukprot:GSA120T00004814001.1